MVSSMIRFVTYFLNNKNWEGRRVQAKKKKNGDTLDQMKNNNKNIKKKKRW